MQPRLVVPLLVLVVAAGLLWMRGADERRVNDACGTWLEHRGNLRWVLSETDEAVGRAKAHGDKHARSQFNDVDRVLASIAGWQTVGPRVRHDLDGSKDASDLERGADSAFGFVDEGLGELRNLIEYGSPSELMFWLPEMSARFQNVDDVCLAAAR
jgi:hypothetical protein